MKTSGARPGLKSAATISLIALWGTSLLSQAPARAQSATQPTVEQLQKEIRKRDAVIEDLLHRVENLERRVGSATTARRAGPVIAQRPVSTLPPMPQSQAAAAESTTPAAAVPPEASPTQPPAGSMQPPALVAQAQAPPTQPSAPQQQTTQSAPGQFQVNPEAAEHALERTLTVTGALLVPNGFAEVQPSFSYTRREIPNLVVFTDNRNEFTGAMTVRIGLPWETQLDLGVPYVAAQHELVDTLVSPQQLVSEATGNSFGDVTVGFSKTLLHEKGLLPDLIGRISYEAPTGPQISNHVALQNSGQSRLGFSLTALKRQDPLAFVAGIQYLKSFTYENLNPGNQLSFVGGAYLATSPQTTLYTILTQSFVQAPEINSRTIPGGNTVQSILSFGASSILGRGFLLDMQVGIGLTQASPKYIVLIDLPIRFGIPGF